MDSAILLITAGSFLTIGTIAGFYIASLFATRRIQRENCQAWKRARTFYENSYTLTPKQ